VDPPPSAPAPADEKEEEVAMLVTKFQTFQIQDAHETAPRSYFESGRLPGSTCPGVGSARHASDLRSGPVPSGASHLRTLWPV